MLWARGIPVVMTPTNESGIEAIDLPRCHNLRGSPANPTPRTGANRIPGWPRYLAPPDAIDNVASRSYIVSMKSVGLRELKNRLSEYVREVRSGEGVLVTDRGQVVAELFPPGQGVDERSVPSGLVTLARKGQLTLGASNDEALYPELPPLLKRHRVATLLDEERGTR
ncbi:MAG TPA: type II toxin-antitoxin system prevent-host-death family antitoxin [Candidatus Nitrosotalea sp.]|nr:type II toxin-antitoxin system prevent-host-death family antitoxin [Candidatus Nitrosotalea sp.]